MYSWPSHSANSKEWRLPTPAASIRWGHSNTPVRESTRGEKGKVERVIEGLRRGEVATTQNYYIDPPLTYTRSIAHAHSTHTSSHTDAWTRMQAAAAAEAAGADETHWPFTALLSPLFPSPPDPLRLEQKQRARHGQREGQTASRIRIPTCISSWQGATSARQIRRRVLEAAGSIG